MEIHRSVDGWAGALMLLTAYFREAIESRAVSFSGKEAVFDYFAGQIFDRAPQAEREVLMKTALLPHVTPDAAVALSGVASAPKVLDQCIAINTSPTGAPSRKSPTAITTYSANF